MRYVPNCRYMVATQSTQRMRGARGAGHGGTTRRPTQCSEPNEQADMQRELDLYLRALLAPELDAIVGVRSSEALVAFARHAKGVHYAAGRSLAPAGHCRAFDGGLHLSLVVEERDDSWLGLGSAVEV